MRNDSRVMVAAVRINTRVVICQSAKKEKGGGEEEEKKQMKKKLKSWSVTMVGK